MLKEILLFGGEPLRPNMKAERARRDLTLQEVAASIGVDPQTVGKWERGVLDPNWKYVVRLCALFGCNAEYLMSEVTQAN